MKLSAKTIDYIESLNIVQRMNSNFLISDLEQIIYSTTNNNDDYYLYSELSKDLLSLIGTWNALPINADLLYMENQPTIQIISNDTQKYAALMIFPIYLNNKIEGLAIFFRNRGDYISSSSKASKTIRNFIMQFMGDNAFFI